MDFTRRDPAPDPASSSNQHTRRDFLRTAMAASAAASLWPLAGAVAAEPATSPSTAPTTRPDFGEIPAAFGRVAVAGIDEILRRQNDNGCLGPAENASPNPQQAIFPMAFAYAGLDPDQRYKGSQKLGEAIAKLGKFLLAFSTDKGEWKYDSRGFKLGGVDQRLVGAWVEALKILKDAKADISTEGWAERIEASCRTLIDTRLKKIEGVERIFARTSGTGTNHVSLYISAVYRAGMVLGKKDLCDYALPIGRALAKGVHPDGYWEEHDNLLREVGPTLSYNYLTLGGVGLMQRYTGEEVFTEALRRATKFHGNFCYPDATFVEVLDERVRGGGRMPQFWGLFAFSGDDAGRAVAAEHFRGFLQHLRDPAMIGGESAARFCENIMYWIPGPFGTASFTRPDHKATLTLPGGIFRKGPWTIGLSAIPATAPRDPMYRENGFALDRQKLFSVWHERFGLVLDGSNSKNQKENSTFWAPASYGEPDYYPVAGQVREDGDDLVSRATYSSFIGEARLRVIDGGKSVRITLKVDPVASRGPFNAGFTLRPSPDDRSLRTLDGQQIALGDEDTTQNIAKGFTHGNIRIEGPADGLRIQWPISPYNSYAADHKSNPRASFLRVFRELTFDRREASFVLTMI